MGEFCQGVVFAYSVLFNDKRNEILENINSQDTISEVLSEYYNEFFLVDKVLFSKYVNKMKQSDLFIGKSHESLVPVPKTLELPDNYMEFHTKYNDLICHEC